MPGEVEDGEARNPPWVALHDLVLFFVCFTHFRY